MSANPAAEDAAFRDYRRGFIYAVNDTAYVFVAVLIVGFTVWDRYVDPAHAGAALWVRVGGAALVLGSGVFQRVTRRVEWAPRLAKFRMLVTAVTIAWALALLDRGFLVGLSGLIIAMLGAAHSAIDRRDVFWLFLPPLLATTAIMLLAGVDRFVFVNATFFLGLTFLVALLLARVLEQANRRAYRLEQALLRESRLDALTGVANRRALGEHARQALGLACRHGTPVSALLLDIDHFKVINDRHGHALGDEVLRAIATHCRSVMRDSDCFGRWGGEEFVALLPDTPATQARELAERLRASIAARAWVFGSLELHPTISIGVAEARPQEGFDPEATWSRLVDAADAAMYRAKALGRNRVEGDAMPAAMVEGGHGC
jgi:diguanylate cyclase (GGDEF)-like protein